MKFFPIFSDEIEKFLDKNVALIGKVIKIYNERKYIKLVCLDKKGYFEVIIYEPIDISEFSTIIILGKIRKYMEKPYVYAKRIVKIDLNEEIFWRKSFINSKKTKVIKSFSEKEDFKEIKEKREEIRKDDTVYDRRLDLRRRILNYIRDKEIVSFEELLETFSVSEEELKNIIEDLLLSGEIYEPSPNKYKVV